MVNNYSQNRTNIPLNEQPPPFKKNTQSKVINFLHCSVCVCGGEGVLTFNPCHQAPQPPTPSPKRVRKSNPFYGVWGSFGEGGAQRKFKNNMGFVNMGLKFCVKRTNCPLSFAFTVTIIVIRASYINCFYFADCFFCSIVQLGLFPSVILPFRLELPWGLFSAFYGLLRGGTRSRE